MKRLKQWMKQSRSCGVLWSRMRLDLRGQDLIEYALMARVVAVASAAVLPSATTSINTVFSKVSSVLSAAGGS
jgi:pilus assembly protein Flp/PilA